MVKINVGVGTEAFSELFFRDDVDNSITIRILYQLKSNKQLNHFFASPCRNKKIQAIALVTRSCFTKAK